MHAYACPYADAERDDHDRRGWYYSYYYTEAAKHALLFACVWSHGIQAAVKLVGFAVRACAAAGIPHRIYVLLADLVHSPCTLHGSRLASLFISSKVSDERPV